MRDRGLVKTTIQRAGAVAARDPAANPIARRGLYCRFLMGKEMTPRKPSAAAKARARAILARLTELYPDATCELNHEGPFQLLIATILSAQTTDKAVNRVTPQLFQRYKDAAALAAATPAEVESLIATIGLHANKARAIVGAAQALVAQHGGATPRERAALEALPGVGRKTASVVLATAFGEPALAVDTHVARLAGRLGLSAANAPGQIELDLIEFWPPERWSFISHALIWHGRRVCAARAPRCEVCGLAQICPSARRGPPRAAGRGTPERLRGAARRPARRKRA